MNINKNIPKTTTFSLDEIETDSINKMIENLDSIKNGTLGKIPASCPKGVSDISAKFLHTVWNDEVLKDLKFPSELKLADVVPAFKKEDSTLVENYRPISLLPIISKIFDRIMLDQITRYMNGYLSPYLCGYKKGFNTKLTKSNKDNNKEQQNKYPCSILSSKTCKHS